MGPCLRRDDGGGAAGPHRQIQRLSAAPEQASQQHLRKHDAAIWERKRKTA